MSRLNIRRIIPGVSWSLGLPVSHIWYHWTPTPTNSQSQFNTLAKYSTVYLQLLTQLFSLTFHSISLPLTSAFEHGDDSESPGDCHVGEKAGKNLGCKTHSIVLIIHESTRYEVRCQPYHNTKGGGQSGCGWKKVASH